jgi:hypothetical protein
MGCRAPTACACISRRPVPHSPGIVPRCFVALRDYQLKMPQRFTSLVPRCPAISPTHARTRARTQVHTWRTMEGTAGHCGTNSTIAASLVAYVHVATRYRPFGLRRVLAAGLANDPARATASNVGHRFAPVGRGLVPTPSAWHSPYSGLRLLAIGCGSSRRELHCRPHGGQSHKPFLFVAHARTPATSSGIRS